MVNKFEIRRTGVIQCKFSNKNVRTKESCSISKMKNIKF